MKKSSKFYIAAAVFFVLAFVPDPTDLLDAGLPFLELVAAAAAAFAGRKVNK